MPNLPEADLRAGARRLAILRAVRQMRTEGVAWHQIRAGASWQSAYRLARTNAGREDLTAADLAPRRRIPRLDYAPEDIAAIRALYLDQTNVTRDTGSASEAARLALERGRLSAALAQELGDRTAEGRPLLPERLRRAVLHGVSAPVVRAARAPRDAWLENVESPGSLQFTIDEETGEERLYRPGECWTLDDATLNFAACVALERPGDRCWERFGCIVGRFQFLLPCDHRSYYLPGLSYTARPKSSYRAEDLVATLHTAFREHGHPRRMVLERGVSASNLVHNAVGGLGIQIIHVKSPHQKPVEFVFHTLHNYLAPVPGQVGRYAGDVEETNTLVQSCRRGATDPREKFWPLPRVLEAVRAAVVRWNDHTVESRLYGRWVPAEWWQRESGAHLHAVAPEDAWLFHPHVTDPLVVRGMLVKTSVAWMPGHSVRFAFSGDWLLNWQGARVRLHFNPFTADDVMTATAVLAEDYRGSRAGIVLGELPQVDRLANYTRRAFGYSEASDIGLAAVRQSAQALRRAVVSIRADGSAGAQDHEARDGAGRGETIRVDSSDRSVSNSAIRTPRSATERIRNPQSAIRNPHSALRNQPTSLDRPAALDPRLREFLEETA